MKKLIAVFGPGSVTEEDALYKEAREMGARLAENNFVTLTGGYAGVMEAASRGASERGGSVVGVTAEVYHARGRVMNPFVTREVRVKSANDRLMELIDLADAYVAIGNSTGTLLEVMTAWDYMIKRFISPKPLLLMGEAWRAFHSYATNVGFARMELVEHVEDPATAMDRLIHYFGIQHNFPELNVVQR
jgi:uncharacterized protein (TIGR00725 family)